MVWILFSVLLFLGFPAHSMENPLIRVRMNTASENIELEGVGLSIRGSEKGYQLVAIPRNEKIEISRDTANGQAVWKVVRNGRSEILSHRFLALKGSDLRSGGKSYPGQILLSPQGDSQFDVIGILPLENYLVGVLASEMPLSWPLETLKAQAVAARSYALQTMKERSRQIYHVESTILDQVFTHIGNGPDDSPLVAKAKQAVKLTESTVLKSFQNQLVKAFYHSDCGGRTATSKSVWGTGSVLGSVIDQSCPSNPKSQWNLTLSKETLSARLKAFLGGGRFNLIHKVELLRPSQKERVEQVFVSWDTGEKSRLSAQEFRSVVGFDQLRSALFEVDNVEGGFRFRGAGFGHGVGLCQWGARQLGIQGKSYREILSHYYPQSRLVSLGLRTEQTLEVRTR